MHFYVGFRKKPRRTMNDDMYWTTCIGCNTSLYEYELCPECGLCDRCCECDLVLTRLLRDLEALVQALREEAMAQVPEEYRSRGLEAKYLKLDVEAGGLYEAACQIEEIIRKYKPKVQP